MAVAHPKYKVAAVQDMHKTYHFGGWSCQIGNRKAADRGHA